MISDTRTFLSGHTCAEIKELESQLRAGTITDATDPAYNQHAQAAAALTIENANRELVGKITRY